MINENKKKYVAAKSYSVLENMYSKSKSKVGLLERLKNTMKETENKRLLLEKWGLEE